MKFCVVPLGPVDVLVNHVVRKRLSILDTRAAPLKVIAVLLNVLLPDRVRTVDPA